MTQFDPVTSLAASKGYLDLHCHILPGVDDGAKDLDIAIEMARLALADGVRLIVATPHPNEQTGMGRPAVVAEAVQQFRAALKAHGLDALEVLPGTECYLVPELLNRVRQGQLTTLNNSAYLLVEFHTIVAPAHVEQFMFELRNAGYVPIIAHPERYTYVQQDLEWLTRLVRLGCLTQLTAGAFYGKFGKRGQKAAETILQHNMGHLIASDAHNIKVRAPGIDPARPVIEKLLGSNTGREVFRQLAVEVPIKIVHNQFFEPDLPERVAQKAFWKFW